MKVLKKDLRSGFVHVLVQSVEDLWYLSHIIDPNDKVRAKTERKIKIGGEDARNQKIIRKKMALSIVVEKVSYKDQNLRVLGTIVDGPDDVARGAHHSFNVGEQDDVQITKVHWPSWQLEKLEESMQEKESILLVLFDRQQALFALLSNAGYTLLSNLKGAVAKKDMEKQAKGNFWKEIAQQISVYLERYKCQSIIAASSPFWKTYVSEQIDESISKKVIYASVSSVDEQAISELLKRPELSGALKKDRSAKESLLVDDLLKTLSKDQLAYGFKDVSEKVNEGSVKEVVISDTYLLEARENNTYRKIDDLLRLAESMKAKVHIITTKEALKQIDGLGGIAGTLRW